MTGQNEVWLEFITQIVDLELYFQRLLSIHKGVQLRLQYKCDVEYSDRRRLNSQFIPPRCLSFTTCAVDPEVRVVDFLIISKS